MRLYPLYGFRQGLPITRGEIMYLNLADLWIDRLLEKLGEII